MSSIILLIIFIKKIGQFLQNMNEMHMNTNSIDDAINNNNNNNNNNVNFHINRNEIESKQFKFISLVARLFTLVASCLSLTLISIGILIFAVNFSSYGTSFISIFGAAVDVTVNAICLVLHWKFATIWYKKLCMICSCYTKSIRLFIKIFKINTYTSSSIQSSNSNLPQMNKSTLTTSSATSTTTCPARTITAINDTTVNVITANTSNCDHDTR